MNADEIRTQLENVMANEGVEAARAWFQEKGGVGPDYALLLTLDDGKKVLLADMQHFGVQDVLAALDEHADADVVSRRSVARRFGVEGLGFDGFRKALEAFREPDPSPLGEMPPAMKLGSNPFAQDGKFRNRGRGRRRR